MDASSTSSVVSSSSSSSQLSSTVKVANKALKGVGNLIKLLPTGTVFLFQFLNPLLTNKGHCSTVNKIFAGILLFVCGFSCCFSCFTDSYVDPANKKLYYGIVTSKGLWLFYDPNKEPKDLSSYKLAFADFVHAAFSLLVFAVVALLDDDTVSCYYSSLESEQQTLLKILPTIIGGASSVVFALYPDKRNEIGYPPATVKKGLLSENSN